MKRPKEQVFERSIGGLVHLGFEQPLLSVYPWIQDWLARSSPTPLLLTGHSLGAAVV